MFDKVFKHEVLFIGYLILACVISTPWAALWFSLVALVHGLLTFYYMVKSSKDKQQEDKKLKQQENV